MKKFALACTLKFKKCSSLNKIIWVLVVVNVFLCITFFPLVYIVRSITRVY
jgi:hypothetical protein